MFQEKMLTLPKIGCQGCMKKVVRALSDLPSVEIIATNVAGKSVQVRYDADIVGLPQFAAALQTIGHVIAPADGETEEQQASRNG